MDVCSVHPFCMKVQNVYICGTPLIFTVRKGPIRSCCISYQFSPARAKWIRVLCRIYSHFHVSLCSVAHMRYTAMPPSTHSPSSSCTNLTT